jgi:hypothetical protein
MQRVIVAGLVVAFAALTGMARADDKSDPNGTWKWTITGMGGQARTTTLKLKMDGDKLAGAVMGRNNEETAIEDAKYKNGEISFTVTRERQGQKFTMKYHGKVTGDTIKGKITIERDGQSQDRDWEAKRAKSD